MENSQSLDEETKMVTVQIPREWLGSEILCMTAQVPLSVPPELREKWLRERWQPRLKATGLEKEVKDSRGKSNKWGGFPATSRKRRTAWKR